jgi:FkbM family methyltransferase
MSIIELGRYAAQCYDRTRTLGKILKIWRRIRTNAQVIGFWPALQLDLAVIYNFRCRRIGLPPLKGFRLFHIDGIQYPVGVRVGTSDYVILQQIFAEHEYAPLLKLRELSLILDGGANVGYASIWFLNHFPSARVIAVEPDPANYQICRQNLAPYGQRVSVLNTALWSHPTGLVRCRTGLTMEAAAMVRKAAGGEKPDLMAVDIPSLIEMSREPVVDLLKLDIEGAESEVFRAGTQGWLRQVKNVVIEIHGPECEGIFSAAMQSFDFECVKSGELTICLNITEKQALPQ